MEVYLLYVIDKCLSDIFRETIGQPDVTLVRDECFDPGDGFVWNQASESRHTDVDKDGWI